MHHARTHARTVFAHCITLSCGHTLDFLPHHWNGAGFSCLHQNRVPNTWRSCAWHFLKIKFPTPPRGARGASQTFAQWHARVKNICLLTCRWARPMFARELMRVWQQTAEGHVPWPQRRVGEQRQERSGPDCTGGRGGRTYNPRARTQRERERPRDVRGTK